MRSGRTTRQVRLVYSSPATDIPGSVEIGVRLVATRAASKLILGAAIRLLAMAALMASTAGVSRIYGDQRDSGQLSFVLQKQPELRERPGMQSCTLLSPGLDPFAYATQFFDGNASLGAFSFGNDLLGNYVIGVRGKPLFFASKFLQPALRSTGLLLLELSPQPVLTVTHRLHMRTGVPFAVRVAGNIGDPEVDTEKVGRNDRAVIWQVYRAIQVELPVSIHKVGLSLDAVEPLFLVFAIEQRDKRSPAGMHPETNAVHSLEPHDALVIGDRTVGFKDRAFLLVPCEAFDCFTYRPYRHLRRQIKAFTDLGVSQLVNRGLAKHTSFNAALRCERSSLIGPLHSCKQPSSLFSVRQKLQLKGQFQYLGVYHSVEEGKAISLPAKAGSLLASKPMKIHAAHP
jgi:hypothetical protein